MMAARARVWFGYASTLPTCQFTAAFVATATETPFEVHDIILKAMEAGGYCVAGMSRAKKSASPPTAGVSIARAPRRHASVWS